MSSDWINFFRGSLERRLGGVAIEMAGAVGSVESPEVYRSAISRTPQQFVDASHSAGCRTLFRAPHGVDATGALHVPVGYTGETKAFGTDMAGPIVQALKAGRYHNSHTNQIWGARASICIRLQNELFILGANLGVFAQRPAYNATCTIASPVAANGGSTGESLRSNVAAFQIGDGEFISIPGEAFPYTYLRGFLGPQDMPDPSASLPPWLVPHMHAPFRFVDGLGEDMLGYIFPAGNAVGIPSATDLDPSSRDRFGCGHSDDSESTSAQAGNIVGDALVRLLDRHGGASEEIVRGRYILPSGRRSRDPLGRARDQVHDRSDVPPHWPRGRRSTGKRARRTPRFVDVPERPAAACSRPGHAWLLRCARAPRLAGRVPGAHLGHAFGQAVPSAHPRSTS